MRRIASITLGIAAVVAMGLVLALGTAEAASHASVPQQGNRSESPCIAVYKKIAEPSVVLLGETVDVTLTATAVCAGETFPLHIVLVLDSSGSMAGSKNRQMKQAARTMIERLDMEENPATKVGVVSFNTTARTHCQLTNQQNRAIGCINQVGAGGGTRIDRGIEEGMKVLRRGRNKEADRESIREVMIVLSDGGNNAGCPPVLQAAGSAKSQGVLVITVCVGSDCDTSCMRRAATSPRYFFEARNASALGQVFDRIREDIINIDLRKLTVVDILPSNMRYIPDVGDSAPKWDENLRELEWQTVQVPKEGITYTVRVEPLEVGFWPTNVEAKGTFLDNKNRSGEFTFEVPYVTVLNPNVQGTPSAPPPPPTYTPTPPPTPTPRPRPIYLPVNLKQKCQIQEHHADIVLVLDMSTSMTWPTQNGRQKVEAVQEASKSFAATIDMTPNELDQYSQVGVVGFNHDAWVEAGLTNNLGDVYSAIDRLPDGMRQHTRLDLAVERGGETALGPGHKADNTPVVILLTDGLPNQVPYDEDGTMETTILRKAETAKQLGVVFYTIGVGVPNAIDPIQRINPDLLKAIAGDPARYFETSDAEGVTGIYSQLKIVRSCTRIRWGDPIP